MKSEPTPRARAVERLRGQLLRRGSRYVLMVLFLLATGTAGFLASVGLHAAGLDSMAVRYPLAVGLAYLTFLLLLAFWVWYHRLRRRRAGLDISAGDWYLLDFLPDPADVGNAADAAATIPRPGPVPDGGPAISFGGGGGSKDGDAVALVVVVVLIAVAVGAALLACVLALIEAPVLFAEALVDGALLVGLARRLRARHGPHWAGGVVRRTWLPVLLVAVAFGLVGSLLRTVVPGATTMGQAIRAAAGGPDR